MIDAAGRRLCDKEIWSRSNKVWCGCRMPAVDTVPSKWVCAGLDFCKKHLPRERKNMDELDEVIGKLSAAALQCGPKDDQIIADHIRDSVALLLRYRHKIRARVSNQNIREDV